MSPNHSVKTSSISSHFCLGDINPCVSHGSKEDINVYKDAQGLKRCHFCCPIFKFSNVQPFRKWSFMCIFWIYYFTIVIIIIVFSLYLYSSITVNQASSTTSSFFHFFIVLWLYNVTVTPLHTKMRHSGFVFSIYSVTMELTMWMSVCVCNHIFGTD